MTPKKKQILFKIVGILLCTVPAAVTALSYFPLWMQNEKSAISVFSLLVLGVCVIPLRNVIANALKSPAAWQLWLVLWILLSLLDAITEGLRAVSAVAFPTNLLGALFFWLARREAAKAVGPAQNATSVKAADRETPHE